MGTTAVTVHLPQRLLSAVDRRARALNVSRTRLIVKVLERELAGSEWSSGFFEELARTDVETQEAIDALSKEIRARRRSKRPRPA